MTAAARAWQGRAFYLMVTPFAALTVLFGVCPSCSRCRSP